MTSEVIDLHIVVSDSPDGEAYQFRFSSIDGEIQPQTNLPDPEAAKQALELNGEKCLFPSFHFGQESQDVFGGDQRATVTGNFLGRHVDAKFSRTDSRNIARWRALAPLLGAVAGGNGEI